MFVKFQGYALLSKKYNLKMETTQTDNIKAPKHFHYDCLASEGVSYHTLYNGRLFSERPIYMNKIGVLHCSISCFRGKVLFYFRSSQFECHHKSDFKLKIL